jgi:hypothetical protein
MKHNIRQRLRSGCCPNCRLRDDAFIVAVGFLGQMVDHYLHDLVLAVIGGSASPSELPQTARCICLQVLRTAKYFSLVEVHQRRGPACASSVHRNTSDTLSNQSVDICEYLVLPYDSMSEILLVYALACIWSQPFYKRHVY